MRKILIGLVFAVFIPFSAMAQMVSWEEGVHYKVIADEATAKPEVKEFFSFWCPACYSFEPVVGQIKSKLSEDVKFEKIHVNFMGFTSADIQDEVTKAMMIARSLKKSDELNAAIFNYIHRQRATITGLDDVRKLFIVNGVESEDFDKQAKSFSTNSLVAKNNNMIAEYREYLTGVPNFIVNGKYQVILARGMSADDYADLVVWLSEQA